MKTIGIWIRTGLTAGLMAVAAPAAMAAGAPPAAVAQPETPATKAALLSTPAERRMRQARQAIERAPGDHEPYVQLALALARRARETSDPAFYAQAQSVLDQALAMAPDGFEALKVQAWVLLGQHRFAEARDLALALNKRVPDDVTVYGLLSDAHAELGEYAAAEQACDWMLDLRPGSVASLTRAAYLRELFGDLDGAQDLMRAAFERSALAETEDRAWILTQIGHLHYVSGRPAEAEAALTRALASFPGYHYALGELARVRTAQGRHGEAVELLEKRQATAPHPENLYELAEALERAGRGRGAREAFARFEREARAEMDGPDNANRELILFYCDHRSRPAEALRLARAEIARRRDVFTLDAHAWALHAAGRRADAREQIEAALAVGTRDPRILGHAAAIAEALGDRRSAERFSAAVRATGAADQR